MGYAAVAAMVGAKNLVIYMPLCIHAIIVTSQITLKTSGTVTGPLGFLPKMSIFIKLMDGKLRPRENRVKLQQMKHDIEVYMGFYLIIVWCIGWSHLLSIFFFWQIMRVRCMISAEI